MSRSAVSRAIKHEEVEKAALNTSLPESSPASPEPVKPAAPADTEPEEQVASIESDQYDSAEDIEIDSAGCGRGEEPLWKASVFSLREPIAPLPWPLFWRLPVFTCAVSLPA
ncbi:hypothetical protein E4U09_007199 [Claviceps aff. purpurea]|uniref:Uncharacterized protein n=1 Tax=Claviceps aff. purpurea TaxID=1967640 RepID=A0A9P7U2Z8_9HYPO|nr:hypothetical protein E4U09_007199 [Claviceps aff. purpurea]